MRPAGLCSSWNGKVCGSDDRVDVGRGDGSCNSNKDCPCCAPYCSEAGYCQTSNVVSLGNPKYLTGILSDTLTRIL